MPGGVKHLKIKNILAGLVVLCSLFSVYAAIRISVNVTGKPVKEEMPPLPAAAGQQVKEERITLDSLEKLPLYYNGRLLQGAEAYVQKKGTVFLPLDVLCMETAAPMKVYSADGMVNATLFGQKLSFRIQEPAVLVNDKRVPLNKAPDAAVGHILMPEQLFPELKGITTGFAEGKAVFLNAYPAFEKEMPSEAKVLRQGDKNIQVLDMRDRKTLWNASGSNLKISGSGSVFLIRDSKGQSLLQLAGHNMTVSSLSPELGDRISGDGNYLYRLDPKSRTASVYDIRTQKATQLDDFYFKALPDIAGTTDEFLLYAYGEGKGYRRVIVENPGNGTFRGLVERWGKTVVDGEIQYSPDHQRILFYRPGKGFYTTKADGTSVTFVGDGIKAEWIHNRSTLVHTLEGGQILYRPGKGRVETTHQYHRVGETANGEVLFTRDGVLFSEKMGKETRRMALPFACSYASGISAGGPLLVVPEGMNTGIYVTGSHGGVWRAGEQYWLLKYPEDGQAGTDLERSILPAPDGKKAAIFQQQGSLTGVKLLDMTAGTEKTVVLDILQDKGIEPAALNAKWVSGDQLLVYTSERSWLIKADTGVQVYSRYEEEGCRILGVF